MSLSPGSRLGPYEIQSELGRGGMGEVYRARDTRLGRDVAVKILPAAFAADPESVRRFEKEAQAVASLSHPNIVTLLDVGEHEGTRYAVAELVAGQTLRARMAAGPLSPRESTDIAAQIAEGLAAAHEKGVVHRDIKPENVVLTPSGFARILDFGLAKKTGPAIGAAADEEATQSALMTEPGVVAGTVGYMSPEQVRGESVDGRSDVFSLGIVLWEMLAGQRPFRGDSQVETLHAILKEEPSAEQLATAPVELEEILRRCLEKRSELRYHSAADLAHDLRKAIATLRPASAVRPRRATPTPSVRAGRERRRRPLVWGSVLLAVLVLGLILFTTRRRSAAAAAGLPRTLAVLPFRAISAEGMPERFGLGLADSLIGHLASVSELTVRPTSAIARYDASPANPTEVARALEVDAVLEGTYQRLEGMTRVSVQMTDASRGSILWSERIDLPEGRLFELQDAIARRVVDKLRVRLDPAASARDSGGAARIPDRVIETYLAARAGLKDVRLTDAPSRRRIAASFDPVISEQPGFAPALGARAYARAALAFTEPTAENYRAALTDAERAVAIDPDLAEPRVARAALAWTLAGGWDVVAAVRELKRLTVKYPGLDIARQDLAMIYEHSGWFSEAAAEYRAIERIHPAHPGVAHGRVDAPFFTGDCVGAREEMRRLTEEIRRTWWIRKVAASCHAALDDPGRAEPEVDRLLRDDPDPGTYLAIRALLRARSGRGFEDLEREARSGKVPAGHSHHIQVTLAQAHAVAGDIPGTVGLLRAAANNGFPCLPCYENDPLLMPVRGSSDYADFRNDVRRRDAGYRAALKDVM